MPIKQVHKSFMSINKKTFFNINFFFICNTNEKTKIVPFYINFVC